MVGWHHRLKGHKFEQTPGVGDGQGSLVCCSPWGRRKLDMTEQLNNFILYCLVQILALTFLCWEDERTVSPLSLLYKGIQ